MIPYWANAGGRWAMEEYLARQEPDLAGRVTVRACEELGAERARVRHHAMTLQFLTRWYERPIAGWVFRAAYRALLPRR